MHISGNFLDEWERRLGWCAEGVELSITPVDQSAASLVCTWAPSSRRVTCCCCTSHSPSFPSLLRYSDLQTVPLNGLSVFHSVLRHLWVQHLFVVLVRSKCCYYVQLVCLCVRVRACARACLWVSCLLVLIYNRIYKQLYLQLQSLVDDYTRIVTYYLRKIV